MEGYRGSILMFFGLVCVVYVGINQLERRTLQHVYKHKQVVSKTNVFVTTEEPKKETEQVVVPRKKEKCKSPVSTLVYIKTHKTGSTTLRRLLRQYYERHHFTNAKTKEFFGPFVGGYPGRFHCIFKYPENATFSKSHTRFNAEEMQKCFPPETKYITIIREPWAAFQSGYDYYAKTFQDNKHCFGMPLTYVVNGQYMDVQTFLLKASILLNDSVPWYFRFRNYQSHDLGLDPMLTDKEEIEKQIQKLDNDLDLVIINEYMEESMVLLKDTMCMNWNDVRLSTRVSSRRKTPFKTDVHRQAFHKLNHIDIALYEHFNRTLWKRVEAYGRKRFAEDLEKLRAGLHRYKREFQDIDEEMDEESWSELVPGTDKWKAAMRNHMISNAGDCYVPK